MAGFLKDALFVCWTRERRKRGELRRSAIVHGLLARLKMRACDDRHIGHKAHVGVERRRLGWSLIAVTGHSFVSAVTGSDPPFIKKDFRRQAMLLVWVWGEP